MRAILCLGTILLATVVAAPALAGEGALPPPQVKDPARGVATAPSASKTGLQAPTSAGSSTPTGWTTPAYVAPEVAPAARVVSTAPGAVWVQPTAPAPLRSLFADARGPIEIRDEWLLAQPRLTLPAFSPDPLARGEWRVRVYFNMGNDFGWNQLGPAEAPFDRRFLVDGEHRTLEVGVRRGLTPCFDVGVRLPVHWRGGGFMDSIIDWFHRLTKPIGFLDNGRPSFRKDVYRVEGRDDQFNPIQWTEQGYGLGNVELEAHWAFARPTTDRGWRAALVARAGLPTGTGPFETGSFDAGLQVAVAKRLANRLDVYGGVGGTFYSDKTIDGLAYEPWRYGGFLAIEWRPFSTWSLFLQGDASSRLITNLAQYPGVQAYLHVGSKIDLSRNLRLLLGFTENLEDQQATIDFGVYAGVELRP